MMRPGAAWRAPVLALTGAGVILLAATPSALSLPKLPVGPGAAGGAGPASRSLAAPIGSAAGPMAAGGMVTIESDSQQADNRTGVVTASGNVRITYPDRRMVATARQAQYYAREGRLILTGDVDVIDSGGQRIRAERLVYHLGSERLQAEPAPGQQVLSRLRLQVTPSTDPSAPARRAPVPPPAGP